MNLIKRFLLLFIILTAFSLSGCEQQRNMQASESQEWMSKLSNSFSGVYSDWDTEFFYFINNDYSLCKSDLSAVTSEQDYTKMDSFTILIEHVSSFSIHENTIIFTQNNEDGIFYSDLEGENIVCLTSTACREFVVYEGSIFFKDGHGNIFLMDLESEKLTNLYAGTSPKNIFPIEDFLLFIDSQDDSSEIFILSLKTGVVEMITSKYDVHRFFVFEEKVYFLSFKDGLYNICKKSLEDFTINEITTDSMIPSASFIFFKDNIIFSDPQAVMGTSAINLNTGEIEKFTSTAFQAIFVVSDNLIGLRLGSMQIIDFPY